ncbi:N-acetylmuramoyl-L-alanine amidase [Halobacillus yeomjeoni]|uniref:N-acetylmuramoyl-L-alanine amidase n=1 Tax=Halobacillus yeomjeoni TaxID=311194 RepID=UPI001CD2E594|nr:N-acetylmuramoyl-L-alanine amidase [Halobacillus yeomjeoni]MCA0983738.1 N-acetylmuramoyl-L-alanine amidase [Halobacillus yeomjeoni]
MAKKLIALDDGHGMATAGKRTPYIPELGRAIKENEFNRAVVKFLKKELERCGFDTLLVAPTDKDVPLKERTDLANRKKADAYIAVHYNAFDGSFQGADPSGIEVYVYPGYKNKPAGKLAAAIAKHLKQGTQQNFRGIKEANFHVLRETDMIAVLTENGYMDNKREALLMIDPLFQKEVAIEHAKGICEYFNVKYVPEEKEIPSTGFLDVPLNSYYAKDIMRAKALGVLNGYPDRTFRPEQPMKRGDLAIALMNLYDKLNKK